MNEHCLTISMVRKDSSIISKYIAAISWILDHYLLATNAYSNHEYNPINTLTWSPIWQFKYYTKRYIIISSAGIISRLKNTVGWFFVREKYCSGWKNKLNKTDYKPDEQGRTCYETSFQSKLNLVMAIMCCHLYIHNFKYYAQNKKWLRENHVDLYFDRR
jgi:hypothetical protein